MKLDLSPLSYQQFEEVVSALLGRSGYRITARARPGTSGPDLIVENEAGETVFVEVKHFRQPVAAAMAAQFAGDVARYRTQSPGAKGLIVLSGELSRAAYTRIAEHAELEVWTSEDVSRRLAEIPDLLTAVGAAVGASQTLRSLSTTTNPPASRPASARYAERLAKIEAGRTDWGKFEIWCTDILTDIFSPDLGPPDRQTRSNDDLDIMDAIFPIRASTPPWGRVRAEFDTRFVVAEYKNYVEPIGQKQVESIAQYLWEKAKRQFGLLVSRNSPGGPAIAQRRRAWLDQSKMIVFLQANELIEMLQTSEAGEQPFEVIDAQLEGFLRTLTP